MKINTGDVTHIIRELNMQHNTLGRCVGDNAAKNLSRCKEFIRLVLTVADIAHDILGTVRMTNITSLIHRVGLPLWTPAMPKAVQQPKENTLSKLNTELKVVYFPSCLNQTMGLAKGAPVKNSLVDEMCQLLNKAGFEVVFPENMKNLCCGQIWESKGMVDIADRKTRELEEALWEASNHGEYPVLCDQSPCLHRMRKLITRMKLFEPVEFIMTYLKDRLDFHPIDRRIAVHITCSTREMGLANQLVALAKLCSNNVLVPEGIGCCAFAGDKGFTHPEVNKYALRKLRPQIEEQHIEVGYSNSRTCEIGLQTNSGIPYISIAYLVNECTTSKQ
jgi:D-lactate dehydrogenase